MTIAIGTPECIASDRFYGNESINLTLAHPKTISLDQGIVIAAAGDIRSVNWLYDRRDKLTKYDLHQLAKRLFKKTGDFTDAEFLLADGTYLYEVNNESYGMVDLAAIGAGYQYALGAYQISHSTKDSIQAAIVCCPACDWPIDVFTFVDYGWDHEIHIE